ncbi:Protein bunched, class 2/F isoform, partial [Stegodyphus mimosarum]
MTDYRNTGNYNGSQPYVVGILSPSTTLYIDQAPTTRDTVPPNDLNLRRRNTNSFQITSVTVQGSRKNDDIADDSADDLDESHTDDLSSDFLDYSRADNEVSPEDSNPICDDLSPCGPIIFAQLPTSVRDPNMNLSLGVTPTFTAIGPNVVAGGVTMMTSKSESPISAQVPIMNPLPDNWQRRFKVVKIVSSEPFRRGRWLCMDFKDPPATEPADLKNENNGTNTPPTIQITNYDADLNQGDMFGMENYAHVYEIPINQTFNGNFVMGNQQQMYGIILPQSNHVQPVTLVQDLSLQTTATDRNFNNIINNQNILINAIPPHVPEPVVPPPAPFSQRAPSPVPTLINNCIPNQSPPSSQSANDYNISSQPVLNHINAVSKVNQETVVSRSRTNSESNSIVKQLAEKVPVRID